MGRSQRTHGPLRRHHFPSDGRLIRGREPTPASQSLDLSPSSKRFGLGIVRSMRSLQRATPPVMSVGNGRRHVYLMRTEQTLLLWNISDNWTKHRLGRTSKLHITCTQASPCHALTQSAIVAGNSPAQSSQGALVRRRLVVCR